MESRVREMCAETLELLEADRAVLLPLALVEAERFTWAADPRIGLLNEKLGRYFRDNAGSIAADQINVGACDATDAFRIFNRFRALAGDLIAMGAASPLRHGVENGTASNRLDVYDAALTLAPASCGLPFRLESLDDLCRFVRETSLLGGPHSCYTYVRPRPERGVAVEVRCIDKQPALAETMDLAAVAKAIMLSSGDGDAIDRRSASELRSARRNGVTDMAGTCALLDYLRGFLPSDEQRYIDRLAARLAAAPAWRRLSASQRRSGTREMRRQLADALTEEIRGGQSR